MTLIKTQNVLLELVMFLRNNVTDPSTRGTSTHQDYTATAAQTDFVITTNYPTNIESVTQNEVAIAFGTNYTFNYETKTLILTTGATLNDAIVINYHYGDTWIYPDFPRLDLGLSSYPRISVKGLVRTNQVLGLSLDGMKTDFSFRIGIFMNNRNDVIEMVDTLVQLFWTNKKSFYYFNAIIPNSTAGPGIDPTRKKEIYIADIDFTIPIQAQD